MNETGKAIRIIRQARGIRLGIVASNAGVSAPYLSLVERGEREPSLSVLHSLARALEVPFDALILLAQGSKSQLKTESEVAQRVADSVNRLTKAEEALTQILEDYSEK
jgi:transcriptional regulator with XRE-family HTH domain